MNKIIKSGLSLKALGLYFFLKEKPKDWNFSMFRIQAEIKDGKNSIQSAMNELERMNIVKREKTKNEKGQFQFKFVFLDEEEVVEEPVKEVFEPVVVEVVEPEIIVPEKPKTKPKLKTPPKPKEAEKPKTKEDGKLYSKMVEIYFDWFKKMTGVSPKFTIADGSAMKQIINYFKSLNKQNEKEGEDEFEEVIKMFQYVFKHWSSVDPFLQKQTKVIQINSNIQNIINDIINGHKRKSNSKDKSDDARQSRLQNSFNRIDEMLSNKR